MHSNAFKNVALIITIICLLKLTKTATEDLNEPIAKENPNIFFTQVFMIKNIVKQLEEDVEKVFKGLDQQAEIVFNYGFKDFNDILIPATTKNSEQVQEFYNNYNIKLTNLFENIKSSLTSNDHLIWQKTQTIYQKISSLNQCLIAKERNQAVEKPNEILKVVEQLEKQLLRLDNLKQKLVDLNKQEEMLDNTSENLTKIMNEINVKLMSQNHYLENLEKQVPTLQSASQTLDDYIIRKNAWHERCRDGRCHHSHHHHWHRRN